ncbi:MAG TPA: kelch repeat-containing protein, partial [Solirubrobacteraceae bacterium]|nr:kelch repeat-containing protein [Solirubrobacteraceae bacterium]
MTAALLALAAPAAAPAHRTVEDHQRDDAVAPKTAAQERAMTRATQAASADDASAAAAAVNGNEGEVGSWSAPAGWPVVGVHVALMPTGKVLAYDSIGDRATETYAVHDTTRATVWDPVTGTHTDVRVNTGFNLFCSGLAHLLDGSVFLAGGNKNSSLDGIRQTHIFNPAANTWTRGADMAYERWYPTVTGQPNGEMLIVEGGPDTPEVRQRNGSMRSLTSASLNLPLYPWLDVAPDGRTFYSGPDQTMRKINSAGTGSWQSYAQRDSINRDYGGHAMFDVGKILVAGGGNSVRDARVIDINGATPAVSATAPMAYGRRQNNLTLLADGTALATGGNSSGASLVDMNNG